MRWTLFALLVSAAACGIKGPPRPPLDSVRIVEVPLPHAPDAGCCREPR